MTPSRQRRLQADRQQMVSAFESHRHIKVIGMEGEPPERYAIEYRLRSLVPEGDTGQLVRTVHRAEIFLPLDYPRRPPFCRMTTPVFHPNIDPQKVCIGDHWSAGQPLAQLVVQIGEMLAYQSYNVQSPLNGRAAAWAVENMARLPLDRTDLTGGA